MTLFQKALLGGISAFAEFKLIKSGFDDIKQGSDNLIASIAKIAGGAAIGAAGLYTAFGPAGLAMAGITALVAGIMSINSNMDLTSTAVTKYCDEYANVRDEVDKTTKEISNSLDAIEKGWKNTSTYDDIDALKTKYFELAEQTNLTAEQQELLKDMAQELVEKVPELSGVIDTQTGYYTGQKEEIEKLIDKKKEEYRLEALREDYIQLVKDEYKAKKNLKEMEDTLADSKQRLKDKQDEMTRALQGTQGVAEELDTTGVGAAVDLEYQVRELEKAVQDNENKVNEAKDNWQRASDDMEFCWGELKDTAVGTSEETKQKVSNAYEEAKNAVIDKINSIGSNTENVFSRMGSVGANAGSSLTNNFANNISDIPYRARSAFNAIMDRVNAGDIGYDTGTELMNSLADTIDNNSWRIRRALSNSFESNFSGEILDSEGNVSRSAFQIRIPRAYATGGFPEDGLFFANHNEMIGKFSNGKTAVANNDQITQGIKQAVIEGMSEVFANANIGQQNGNIVVQIDGQEVFRTTQRYANQYTNMTGQAAFPY